MKHSTISEISRALEILADVMVSDGQDEIAGFNSGFFYNAGRTLRLLTRSKIFKEEEFTNLLNKIDTYYDIGSEWAYEEDLYQQALARLSIDNEEDREILGNMPNLIQDCARQYYAIKADLDSEVDDIDEFLRTEETRKK